MTDPGDQPNAGDGRAPIPAALVAQVYDELRRIAAIKMAQLPAGQTIQATALVNEAYLKLANGKERVWRNEQHFLCTAAEAMRQIIIDRARRKQCERFGGQRQRVELGDFEIAAPAVGDDQTLLALNEALDEFEQVDREKAQIVKLKFFIGVTDAEIAGQLGISDRTVKRHWAYARAWLFERISNR